LKLEFNFNQSAVIPYRKNNGEIEVLLITTKKKKKWIVPKGFIEFNLSAFESAKKEAYEEAGVIGSTETIELGSYKIKKGIGLCHMKIYSLEVIKIEDDYPEKKERKRKWFSLKDAADAVSVPELAPLILSLKEKIKT